MTDRDPSPVLARIEPPFARRVIAAGMLLGLGLFVVTLAARHPPSSLGLLVLMVAIGLGALWLGWRLWGATGLALELTERELREAGGRVLARIDEVEGVDRGPLAIKPSNGFVLVMRGPGPRVWAPGLWWRLGRRVGVGGVTGRQESRFAAELIAQAVTQRKEAGRTE